MNTRNRRLVLVIFFTILTLTVLTYIYIASNKRKDYQPKHAPETPYNTRVSIDENGCLLTQWQTTEKSIGYIKYGDNPDNVTNIAQTSDGLLYADNHSVSVCTINSTNDYYVIVVSNNIPYGYQGEPIKAEKN